MTTVLLIRHGRTAANASGVLAGWTPGVHLDERGEQQAAALGQRLAPVPIDALVTSPLERCQETAAAIVAARSATADDRQLTPVTDDRLGEAKYGDWTGKTLKELAKEPLWKVVQSHPSAATFPGTDGEAMRAMQARAVDAVREWNRQLGPEATWVAVSHGDVIKSIVADALGIHLDQFQRIQVDPCSLTVVRYTDLRPFVVRMNDTGGNVDGLLPPRRRPRRGRRTSAAQADAAVGGGAGP